MQPDNETVEQIIERVTVDAYGDEGYWSFAQAFEDDIGFPLDATLAGVAVQLCGVEFDGQTQRGLVAILKLDAKTHRASLLDLSVPRCPTRSLIDAYRRWLGIT
ncbi:MAG: hypothetical protein M3096_06420 [Actinomycetia bacterium]|nr:hypothetical protein [Actinomycetes bacterium]